MNTALLILKDTRTIFHLGQTPLAKIEARVNEAAVQITLVNPDGRQLVFAVDHATWNMLNTFIIDQALQEGFINEGLVLTSSN